MTIIALLLLLTVSAGAFYIARQQPGVLLSYILLFTFITNILLDNIGAIQLKYVFFLLFLVLYILYNYNQDQINKKIVFNLKNGVFIGVILVLLAILFDHLDDGISQTGVHKVKRFLTQIVVLFFIASIFVKNRKNLDQFSEGILISGIIFYIVFYLLVDLNNLDVGNRKSLADTGYFNAITLARINGVLLITSLVYFIHNKSKKIRLVCAFIFIPSVYWILVTSTRGVILATIISVLIFFMYNIKNRKNFTLYIMSIVIIVIAFIFIDVSNFELVDRFRKLSDYQTMKRYHHYFISFNVFSENPLFGIGAGRYGIVTRSGSSYPHNLFLELMTEFGIFGLLAGMLITISGFYHAFKILKTKVFDYRINVLVILWIYFYINSLISGNLTINQNFWIMSGALVSIIYHAKKSPLKINVK